MPERTYGSWLLGGPEQSLRSAVRRANVLLSLALGAANLLGAAGAFVLAAFVLPTPVLDDDQHLIIVNLVALAIYVAVTGPLNVIWGIRTSRRRMSWAFEGRAPTAREQRATLRIPVALVRINQVFWLAAIALFGTYDALQDVGLGLSISSAIALGAVLTGANTFFLGEFAMRPLSSRALAQGPPGRLFLPGLRTRALVAWGLGSAVPVGLLMAISIEDLSGGGISRDRFSLTVLTVSGIVLVFGSFLVRLASRATADPIRGVRAALARVEAGDLDVTVPIYDASDVGLLQSGFNRMVAGLRERERIRELFGRQVGEEAAQAALSRGVELGGEVREVAVLFVDVVGSTAMAASRPPTEVVDLLNRFFAVVVEVVRDHGGWVNKFQGDATLAVFGAPGDQDDAPGCALQAARLLAAALRRRVPGCDVGIGVAAGPAVAGHVGAAERYEYTVVGDCVNEAARLSGRAKDLPGRVAASSVAVARAGRREAQRWGRVDEMVLRGRSATTVVMAPAGEEA